MTLPRIPTMKLQGCEFPAEGALCAASRIALSSIWLGSCAVEKRIGLKRSAKKELGCTESRTTAIVWLFPTLLVWRACVLWLIRWIALPEACLPGLGRSSVGALAPARELRDVAGAMLRDLVGLLLFVVVGHRILAAHPIALRDHVHH